MTSDDPNKSPTMASVNRKACRDLVTQHIGNGATESIASQLPAVGETSECKDPATGNDITTAVMTELSLKTEPTTAVTPERQTSPKKFVCIDKNVDASDPFTQQTQDNNGSQSVRRRAQREQLHAFRTTPSASDKVMTNWRVSSEPNTSETSSPLKTRQDRAYNDVVVPDGVVVDKNNCQLYYPPEACLFVANLHAEHDEIELEAAIIEVFRKYGQVFAKITRDKKNMPLAFVQFTKRADAVRAKEHAKGIIIFGRGIRIEWSNANRNYLLTRHDGSEVTEDMARGVLEEFGDIERIHFPSETESVLFNLGRGPLVTFSNYQNGRVALNELRDSNEWNFQAKGNGNNGDSTPVSAKPPVKITAKAYLESYEIERRSIFVGNLPATVTEGQLHDLFGHLGQIINITVNRRPSVREGCDVNVFAFLEFASPATVQQAIMTMNNYPFAGYRLKVDARKPHEQILSARRKAAAHVAPDYHEAPPAGSMTAPPYYRYGGYGPQSYMHSGYPTPFTHVHPYAPSGVNTSVAPPPFHLPQFGQGQPNFYGQAPMQPMLPYAVHSGPNAEVYHHAPAVAEGGYAPVSPAADVHPKTPATPTADQKTPANDNAVNHSFTPTVDGSHPIGL